MSDLLTRFASYSDLHQSPMHAGVMRRIGWQVAGQPGSQIFHRSLGPFTIAKLQRPKVIDLDWLKSFRRSHHTLTTYIEPNLTSSLTQGLHVEPFAHSCTSLLDLKPSEHSILASFSQKTRYNVVRTLRQNNLNIISSLSPASPSGGSHHLTDFFTLHADWSRQKNVIGYSLPLLNAVMSSFAQAGELHLAYHGSSLVASLLVLYHDSVATYWAAFASPEGYRLYAPTLLTWTAIQSAKQHGCDIFDFGGIYDPRYPKMYKKWQGFTKFKSGFNPEVISYPPTTLQLGW